MTIHPKSVDLIKSLYPTFIGEDFKNKGTTTNSSCNQSFEEIRLKCWLIDSE